jgi:hypothetical protein
MLRHAIRTFILIGLVWPLRAASAQFAPQDISVAAGPLFMSYATSFIPASGGKRVLVAPVTPGEYAFRIAGMEQYASVALRTATGEVRTTVPYRPKLNQDGRFTLSGVGQLPVSMTLLVEASADSASSPVAAELPLTWVPTPSLTVRSASADGCSVQICAREGSSVVVEFGGPTARFLTIGGEVEVIKNGTKIGKGILAEGASGPRVEVNVNLGVNDSVPLTFIAHIDRAVYPYYVAGKESDTVVITATALGLSRRPASVIRFATQDTLNKVADIVLGKDRAVMVVCICSNPDFKLRGQRSYLLRDAVDIGNKDPIAELILTNDPSNSVAPGVIRPKRETVLPAGRTTASLQVMAGDTTLHVVDLAVRRKPEIRQVEIMRENGPSDQKILYPGETVSIRYSGPGARWLDSLFFRSQPGKATRLTAIQHLSDVVEATITVPRNVVYRDEFVLTDRNEDAVHIPFEVKPAQRPHGLDFGKLHLGKEKIDLASTRPIKPVEVHAFRRAYLEFDASSIDPPTGPLFGIQYLDIALKVRTPKGEEAASHSACYAIVPPNGARPVRYQVESDCTLLPDGVLRLDDVLNGYLTGSVPHATMDIAVKHQQSRYPDQDAKRFQARFERKGWYSYDWNLGLPTAVMVLSGGPDKPNGAEGSVDQNEAEPERVDQGSVEFQPTGLLYELTPYTDNGAWPLTFHAGAVISTLFERKDKPLSRVAVPLGLSFGVANMKRTVNLKMYVGGMFPITGKVFKDAYLVGYPGFSLNLGGGTAN